ncbi:thioredoxin reductase (NADPH) [Desulfohalotomaculum tongense]|uniref:thioredoxin-disulfide reductase n=1 Tax=Desulforadius tongensis TaxID=1216062 RepID=UPI00195D5B32|nr:thioredoxin-disulfide reductase [Desulforadius tongensis]MBM7854752.1 thioredoxin reductase (NADPH) [Desulforadius tongensis]
MEIRDLAIIGGGPAGLTAGLYAARAALNTVLFERGMPGGQAASTERIENYPGFPEGIDGPELAIKMSEQAQRFGCEIIYSDVDKLERQEKGFKITYGENELLAKAVILATGAKPKFLGVKGEKEFHGRGVSYCATCDGAFFRDGTLAVIGGGDAAVEEAIFLTKFAAKVYIVHRRGELRAAKILQQRAFDNPKIELVWHSVLEEVKGGQKVESVLLKDVRTGEKKEIAVDGVFIYVGTEANSNLLKDLVELDANGYVKAQEDTATGVPGLYVAGDLRKKPLRQVVTAVADGAVAVAQVEKYLSSLE